MVVDLSKNVYSCCTQLCAKNFQVEGVLGHQLRECHFFGQIPAQRYYFTSQTLSALAITNVPFSNPALYTTLPMRSTTGMNTTRRNGVNTKAAVHTRKARSSHAGMPRRHSETIALPKTICTAWPTKQFVPTFGRHGHLS